MNDDMIFYALVIAGVYIMLRFSKKIIGKLIGLALILVTAFVISYIMGIGPFQKNFTNLDIIEDKFCSQEDKKETCDCIVSPLKGIYQDKFSPEQIIALNKDKAKSAYVFVKAMKTLKPEAKACLKAKGREEAWSEFISEVLPFDIGLDQVDKLIDKAGSLLEDNKETKEEIDNLFDEE